MKPVLPLLVNSLVSSSTGEAKQHTPPLSVWTASVAGVFLHSSHKQPKVWSYGGKPHLHPNPLGQEPWSLGEVGRGQDRLPLDRCNYDPTETGRMDPPSSQACGGLFPHQGRSLDQLGVRSQGKSGISRGLQETIRKTQSPWHSLQGWAHRYGFCFRCKSCMDLLQALGMPQPDFLLCSTFLPSTVRLWQYQESPETILNVTGTCW